jgi:hypothetical protein
MKRSRKFSPCLPMPLEGRAVLSQVGPVAAAYHAVGLSTAEVAQSNASTVPFGFGVTDSLHAGYSVAEQLTTNYNDGSTQTESVLKVPNLANNSVTSYETIDLRHNVGTEQVVDTETFSGGSQPLTGNHITHTVTTTLPDGQTQTQNYTQVVTGHRTVSSGTINEANGGVETWSSTKIKHGSTSITNKTITEPDGTMEHQKITTTHYGDLDSQSSTVTLIPSKAAILLSSSATQVIRVQPPSS